MVKVEDTIGPGARSKQIVFEVGAAPPVEVATWSQVAPVQFFCRPVAAGSATNREARVSATADGVKAAANATAPVNAVATRIFFPEVVRLGPGLIRGPSWCLALSAARMRRSAGFRARYFTRTAFHPVRLMPTQY